MDGRERIAKVEPLTTARALRGPFDYLLGDRYARVDVGSVLRVPFGHREILGVVTAVADESEVERSRLATPLGEIGDGVPPELVDLGLWVAEEYCSTPARGLGLVLAPGTGSGGEKVRLKKRYAVSITEQGERTLEDATSRIGARQRAVLAALRAAPRAPEAAPTIDLTRLREATGADSSVIRRLKERGYIHISEADPDAPEAGEAGIATGSEAIRAPELSPHQGEAVSKLKASLARATGEPSQALLHGVTGSGKTEVYLAAAEAALEAGRGAIVMVPEIALTPLAVERFKARLGDRIAVIHSALTMRERFDEWTRLRHADAQVCVGPRSAVFAPVADLGLIVIDEEHDASYKQEQDPRYDAREVADRRMAGRGGAIVAGTATPRPESWLRMERISLPDRIGGRPLPPVELIDMRGERNPGPLHERTLEGLDAAISRGEKAIVLVNRRGFSPWLSCRLCGHGWQCPNCDVSLITHQQAGRLMCHHCAHIEPFPDACPECGSVSISRSGAGTERVEDALTGHFGGTPVVRLDADTTSGRGGHERVLDRFRSPGAAIMVGTQMVAKGHDFPDVTLSVVVDADGTLRFPDFRSEERTFALVTQLAGRSGRGKAGGGVMVQTLAPEASSIRHAAGHDSEGFLAEELGRRRLLRYPPFSHLLRVVLAATNQRDVAVAADRLRDLVSQGPTEGLDLLGPAPMFRVRNRHRRRLLLKSGDRRSMVEVVRGAVDRIGGERLLKGVSISIDVDPQ